MSNVLFTLMLVLTGFVIAFLGEWLHSQHYVIGLVLLFGGVATVHAGFPSNHHVIGSHAINASTTGCGARRHGHRIVVPEPI